MLQLNQIYSGDCLTLLPLITPKSIDLICCDLPYGVTDKKYCNWDNPINIDELWLQFNRLIKDRGVIALTAVQPFTSLLVNSNLKNFRYEIIWQKNINSNFANAKRRPLAHHESILIFYKKFGTYNPQGLIELTKPKVCRNTPQENRQRFNHIKGITGKTYVQTQTNYPKSIIAFDVERGLHATQKSTKLIEYILRTYSNENDVVLDCTAGSATTAIAAINTNRNYIMIEKDPYYYKVSVDRIAQHKVKFIEQIKKENQL